MRKTNGPNEWRKKASTHGFCHSPPVRVSDFEAAKSDQLCSLRFPGTVGIGAVGTVAGAAAGAAAGIGRNGAGVETVVATGVVTRSGTGAAPGCVAAGALFFKCSSSSASLKE